MAVGMVFMGEDNVIFLVFFPTMFFLMEVVGEDDVILIVVVFGLFFAGDGVLAAEWLVKLVIVGFVSSFHRGRASLHWVV